MPLQISVGPPQLVIHHGETVWASDPDGQVSDPGDKGLLFRDTRLISNWHLYANGESWQLTNGGALAHFAARIFLTNPRIPSEEGDVPEHTLSLMLGRWVEAGVHEDIEITNHGTARARFNLEIGIRSDFADLFEIKSGRVVRRGRISTSWDEAAQCLRTAYENRDFLRAIAVTAEGDSHAAYANGRLSFAIDLAPGKGWHAALRYDLQDDGEFLRAPRGTIATAYDSAVGQELAHWHERASRLRSSNIGVVRVWRQAVADMAALSVPVDGEVIPAAGLPWFMAIFGRDSLIASLQTLPFTATFAFGALAVLAARQADELDPERDAEPGKILHELRQGELAHFKLIPHTPYFGTADATPLYLVLLHQTWRWTGERELVERFLPAAERCLGWIDEYGDRDGDGFQEYQTRSPHGYENMGWKDAGDAVPYPDGKLVRGPKALCELQGYVYAGWLGMAELYDVVGRSDDARRLRERAGRLYNRFNDAFWNEERGLYAMTLDGDKRQVLTVASNIGHCLWSGIIRPDRARRVMDVLMSEDMFSGWGVRTLSAAHPNYNPYGYHTGSVWPHDNGLIAQGFRRYGFTAELGRLAGGMNEAARFFAQRQVPELFAGIPRAISEFPVQCLGANVPQAWAAGSAFSFMQALLGLVPDAARGVLEVAPALPDWLPDLELRDLRLGRERFDLRFWRDGEKSRVEVLRGRAEAVIARPA